MRLWSLHPKYLDSKGLVALWREALLAKHVLAGKTKGYKHHPQLTRFKAASEPLACINQYLLAVYREAESRGYHFDKTKIDDKDYDGRLTVTDKQMAYEFQHLLNKLETRDPPRFAEIKATQDIQPHPLFSVIPGAIEDWEVVS